MRGSFIPLLNFFLKQIDKIVLIKSIQNFDAQL